MAHNYREGDLVATANGEVGTVKGWRVSLDGGKWFFHYEVETQHGSVEVREDLLWVPIDLVAEHEVREAERRREELREGEYNATVVSLRKHHSDLAIFRVKPDQGKASYDPGQYTTLGLFGFEPRLEDCQVEDPSPDPETLIRRAYSISHRILEDDSDALANSGDDDFYEFYIVLVRDNGEGNPAPGLTPRLFRLAEGDRISIGKKVTGHYTLHHLDESTRTVVFGGTGTGEAPHMAQIARLLSEGFEGDIVCLEVVRYKVDLGYIETHERLMALYPNYRYVGLSTRDEDVEQKVYIQDYIGKGMLDGLLGYRPSPDSSHWYFCGNPKMIGIPEKDEETGEPVYPKPLGVIEVLEGLGHTADRGTREPGNVHYEEYW